MTEAASPFQQFLKRLPESLSSELLRSSTLRELQLGALLFSEGDSGEFWFLVEQGALDVSVFPSAAGAGSPSVVRRLFPGEMGGLTSLTLGRPRSATLRAAAPSSVYTLPKASLLQLLKQPEFAVALIAAISEQLRRDNAFRGAHSLPAQADTFRVAFFDTKTYDRESFERALQASPPKLSRFASLVPSWFAPRLDPHTVELAAGHHAVCAFVNDTISRETLSRLAALGVRLVALRCAGFNQVDLKAAEELGVQICRVPAYSPHAVAEHAAALLLALNRKLVRAQQRVHDGNFSLVGLVGQNLHGRCAGLIGLGKIGRCFASILLGFGMRVLAYDPGLTHETLQAVDPDWLTGAGNAVQLVSLQELLEQSDVLSLHAPLNRDTRHLLDAERLAQTKPGVVIINTSRGALLDTRALVEALKSGQVSAAGLDVYEEESEYFFEDRSSSVISDDTLARLLSLNNVLITSHQGFLTEDALSNIAQTTLGNLLAFESGAAIPNAVKPS